MCLKSSTAFSCSNALLSVLSYFTETTLRCMEHLITHIFIAIMFYLINFELSVVVSSVTKKILIMRIDKIHVTSSSVTKRFWYCELYHILLSDRQPHFTVQCTCLNISHFSDRVRQYGIRIQQNSPSNTLPENKHIRRIRRTKISASGEYGKGHKHGLISANFRTKQTNFILSYPRFAN
jgi:hypothetical protein